MSRAPLERRLVRFDLALCQDGKPVDRACFDLRVGDEDHEAIIWRAEPDDVRALIYREIDIFFLNGGERWAAEMRDRRAARRSVFKRVAGALGDYLCDQIEKGEGWGDA